MRSAIARAVEILRRGGLVAFPTETVYGLGADARSPEAVRGIFEAKGRPEGHPLIVHLPAIDHLERWACDVPPAALALAQRFWPGPLTIIVPKHGDVPAIVTGGQDTIGLRMPDHPLARELLAAFGSGIAAPSANRFGSVSPTTAEHVRAELGSAVDLILDGGPTRVGIESTIVSLAGDVPRVLRPGAITREAIEAVIGSVEVGGGTVRAPGTLASHYAPRAELRVVARGEIDAAARQGLGAGENLVALAPAPMEGVPTILLADDPDERAHGLYAALREVDERGFEVAIVALPEHEEGIEIAIADRLRRASAPR